MTKEDALTLALEALDTVMWHGGGSCWVVDADKIEIAITAIKKALAQPTSGDYALGYAEGFNDACKRQPERTGWPAGLLQDDDRKLSKWLASKPDAKHVVDMAQPEQEPVGFAVMERPWVGLTDDEIYTLAAGGHSVATTTIVNKILKGKNNG